MSSAGKTEAVGQAEHVGFLLNGEPHQVPEGTSIAGLLEALGLPSDRVAVELEREIVRQPRRETTVINPGVSIEVVEFVGGG